jgi:hypothetical protein
MGPPLRPTRTGHGHAACPTLRRAGRYDAKMDHSGTLRLRPRDGRRRDGGTCGTRRAAPHRVRLGPLTAQTGNRERKRCGDEYSRFNEIQCRPPSALIREKDTAYVVSGNSSASIALQQTKAISISFSRGKIAECTRARRITPFSRNSENSRHSKAALFP